MEIRRSYDRLISTMGFPILVRWHLYFESGPWCLWHWSLITPHTIIQYVITYPCHKYPFWIHMIPLYEPRSWQSRRSQMPTQVSHSDALLAGVLLIIMFNIICHISIGYHQFWLLARWHHWKWHSRTSRVKFAYSVLWLGQLWMGKAVLNNEKKP